MKTLKQEAIKLELIEWVTGLDDDETVDYLKVVKDSKASLKDWWYYLTDEQMQGIERGLKDIVTGRITAHDVVKKKYAN